MDLGKRSDAMVLLFFTWHLPSFRSSPCGVFIHCAWELQRRIGAEELDANANLRRPSSSRAATALRCETPVVRSQGLRDWRLDRFLTFPDFGLFF